ncbi:MAG: heparinase II/III family protein [Cephaloticoccus sp.]|nr:heparinase II/III family protein [Cephaloticoccus sp.]
MAHLFVTSTPREGFRSLDHVRHAIGTGHARMLWDTLLTKVADEAGQPPWIPTTPLPERRRASIERGNRDFDLVARVCNRITDASLAALVSGDARWAEAALRQIDCLYDPEQWPEYEDLTHLDHGDCCSLRRGQLAVALGLAYDWLHDFLTPDQRRGIIQNFDERLTGPFKQALKTGGRFTKMRNNFVPVIYGGFHIAAMAFGEDYAESKWLCETCAPKVEDYLTYFLGPEGEFDESVQYAATTDVVVNYLIARQYHEHSGDPLAANPQIDGFFQWYMYFTLPPGRVVGFGDPAPDMPPVVTAYAAAAAARHNPVYQWFYQAYFDKAPDTHRRRSLELLYFNPDIPAGAPDGVMPLGRAYRHCARLVSSRSSWDPCSTTSVAYGKASLEFNHFHADWGQLCIDGHGERLIPDLGSPSSYPQTYPVNRNHCYYNYQQQAHNVFVFGHNETGGTSKLESHRRGNFIHTQFDDRHGATWSIDLSEVYDQAARVTRTVVHLLPRIVVVLDDAKLHGPDKISLRWHTLGLPSLEADDNFLITGKRARLAARIARLDGPAELTIRRHHYSEPYHLDALGTPLEQRREPYIELSAQDRHCRTVSLFCVQEKDAPPAPWRSRDQSFAINTPEGSVQVSINSAQIEVRHPVSDGVWSIDLPG